MEHPARYQLDVGGAFFEEMARKASNSPGEVVMVIRRPGGAVLLNTKEFYPAGIYRLPSGQMKTGEEPEETLKREAWEETGLSVQIDRRLAAIECVLRNDSRTLNYLSYIIVTKEVAGEPASQDVSESITGFCEVNPCDLPEIAERLRNLREPWRDWGCFRAIAHDVVYRKLYPLNSNAPS